MGSICQIRPLENVKKLSIATVLTIVGRVTQPNYFQMTVSCFYDSIHPNT